MQTRVEQLLSEYRSLTAQRENDAIEFVEQVRRDLEALSESGQHDEASRAAYAAFLAQVADEAEPPQHHL